MWHVWGTGEVRSGFWWGDLSKGGHWEDTGIGGGIIVKWIISERDGGAWT
jgi:hypothetical protein